MNVRKRLLAAGLCAAAIILLLIAIIAGRGRVHRLRTLEVELQASSGTAVQLFWADDPGFAEARSIRVPLVPTPGSFQHLRFMVPSQGIRWLRFDPTDAPGEVLIRQMRLLDPNGQIIAIFDSKNLRAANQIASITQEGDVTRVVTTPGANDPFLTAALGCEDRPSLADSLSLVTPTTLALAAGAAIVLLTACVVVVGMSAFGRRSNVAPPQTGRPSWALPALWMAALFLVVFSAKLVLIRLYPLTVPFWDQWDAEARGLYIPFSECRLSWSQMFSLHNEHRVFFTRLLALSSLVVNNQWDPRLQQVANAAIHALFGVLVATIFWMVNERRRLDLIVFVCVIAFALPFAWDNTLEAFQSAFYFMLLFSFLALWLTTGYRSGGGPWWLGWLCAACAVFTAAGGLLTPVAIIGVVALQVASDRQQWRGALRTIGAAAAVLGLGVVMASPPLAHHARLRAATPAHFFGALGHNLAWPVVGYPQMSVVMWLPIGALLLVTALARGKTSVRDRLILGLGFWVALQAAAIAYGRGAGAPVPATRYQDFLSLGFIANTMALVAWLDRTRSGTTARRLALGALLGWFGVTTVAVNRLVEDALVDLRQYREHWSEEAANVRRFLITGDLTWFTSGRLDLPYPDAQSLASVLRDPEIRRILPAAVREPVHVEPRVVTNDAFVAAGAYSSTPRDPLARGWGTFSSRGNSAQGRFESQPLQPCPHGRRLQFLVAGYLGLPELRLAVRDLRSNRETEVTPRRLAREDWAAVDVSCPAAPYAIVAVDERPDYWFAFREPIEVGWASPTVESLIRSSPAFLFAAIGLLVLAARLT